MRVARSRISQGLHPGYGRFLAALPPLALEAAAHAGAAGSGAGAAVGFGFGGGAHFVEAWFVRGVALGAGAVGLGLVVEGDAHFVEGGFVDATRGAAAVSPQLGSPLTPALSPLGRGR